MHGDSVKQKIADEKNLERLARELDRTQKQLDAAQEHLCQVSIINSTTYDQLCNQEEKCLRAEEAVKSTVEALRRQVKEEIHSRTVLAARINSDVMDHGKNQGETELKTQKVPNY